MKKVKDHLNAQRYWDIFTIQENSDLFNAASLMNKNKIGALMISKIGSEENLCKSSVLGILTERDLVYALSGGAKNLGSKTVKDIMTRKPVTISGKITVSSAISLMNKKKITSLLVTSDKDLSKKNKKLIGVVHIHSILQFGIK